MKAKSLLFITICFINGLIYAQNQMIPLSNLNQYFSNTCPPFYNDPDPDGNTPQPICYADIWGFKDVDGNEYAILCTRDTTSFINITNPANPYEVGFIAGPAHWNRDVKVYTDGSGNKYAYIVGDGTGTGEGLQIVDLSGLPGSVSLVNTWVSSSNIFKQVHNVYIDVPSKRLFLCSIRPNQSVTSLDKGILMLDISNPTSPIELDAFNNISYGVHDVYVKDNLLFACSMLPTDEPDWEIAGYIDIFDISANTFNFLTRHTFTSRSHSVWITEDGNYMVTTSESENSDRNVKFWNIQDIFNIPSTPEDEFRKGTSTTHNAFIKGNFCYISHLSAGLVVLDISDINNVIEVGHYDTYPTDNTILAYGAWGVFPYLPSCNIIISDMQTGLHIVTFPQDLNLQNVTIAAGEEQGYVAKNTITATNFTVESGARSTFVAKDEIDIGGESDIGGEFDARIDDPCAQSTFPSQRTGNINANNHKRKNPAFMNEVNKIINGNYLGANYPNPFNQSTTIVSEQLTSKEFWMIPKWKN